MTTLNPEDSAALLKSLEQQCSTEEGERRVAAAKKRLGIIDPAEHVSLRSRLAEAVGLLRRMAAGGNLTTLIQLQAAAGNFVRTITEESAGGTR